MKRIKVRVTEPGQVTIPKPLRERLGVKPGTLLEFSEEHGRLIAVKSGELDPVNEVYGCLDKKIDTDAVIAVIAELRGQQ
jgi:antitoxin PrlF